MFGKLPVSTLKCPRWRALEGVNRIQSRKSKNTVKEKMKLVLDKVATIFFAAVVMMVPWIAMLGEKGTTPLVFCSLCALALVFTARGEILRSPWLVLAGCFAGWCFVGGANQLAPDGHSLRDGFSVGFTLRDAMKAQSASSLVTIGFFLVYHMGLSGHTSKDSKRSRTEETTSAQADLSWTPSEH